LKTFFRVILESIRFAVTELKLNRTRTFLTLLGISIGIFCIISVFSVVDSMKKTIQNSIESMGSNVLYVQKWPWEFSADFAWWKYMKRPVPTFDEYRELKIRSKTAENVVFIASTMSSVERNDLKTDATAIIGITDDYPVVQPIDIEKGRFFTGSEYSNGTNVAVLGNDIADLLFPSLDPVGQSFKVFNQKVKVIGVLVFEGLKGTSNSHDKSVLLPVQFYRRFIDLNDEYFANTMIMVRVKKGISNVQAVDELTGIMRSVRRLKPSAEDNFSINESSLLTKGFESLFSILSLAGWLIGGFSLLVGGFGIANIMFVSVTERTRIIGVQKAIGAKNQFILFQYLVESVFLSMMGGAIGLIIVVLLTFAVSSGSGFPLYVSFGNVMMALLISAFIGIVSGLAPAFKASRLDPVEAIRR